MVRTLFNHYSRKVVLTIHTSLLSDIDDCADQPCQNGGNCTDAVNDYACNCGVGYSGKNCSIGKDDAHVSEYNFVKLRLNFIY